MRHKVHAALLAGLLALAPGQAQAADFADVPEKAWYHDMVGHAADLGIMKGTAPGLFAPAQTVTRAQLTAVVWNLAGRPQAQTFAHYADVPDTAWYGPALDWAVQEGLAHEKDRFAPHAAVTRQEAVQALADLAALQGVDTLSGEALTDRWLDKDQIIPRANEAFAWALEDQILTGVDPSHLAPRDRLDRAQLACMTVRWQWKLDLRRIAAANSFAAIQEAAGSYGAAYYDNGSLIEKRWMDGDRAVVLSMTHQGPGDCFYYYDGGQEALWGSPTYGMVHYINASGKPLTNTKADPLAASTVKEQPLDWQESAQGPVLTTLTQDGVKCFYHLDPDGLTLSQLDQELDRLDGTPLARMRAVYTPGAPDDQAAAFIKEARAELASREKKRTVTVVLDPGTDNERRMTGTLPQGRRAAIVLPDGYEKYQDPACQVLWQGNEDLTASVTVYARRPGRPS